MTENVAAPELLRHAERLLDGDVVAALGNSARMAAVLSRQALEVLVDERCSTLFGAGTAGASMRVKLILLRTADDPDAAACVRAWHGLSTVCHQHAYDLTPTVGEVRSLCRDVASLLAR